MSATLYPGKVKQKVAADIYLVALRPASHLWPAPDRWRLCILVPGPAGDGTRRRRKPVRLSGQKHGQDQQTEPRMHKEDKIRASVAALQGLMGNPQQTRKIWVTVYVPSGFQLWTRTRLIIHQINSCENPKTRAGAHSVKLCPRLFVQSNPLQPLMFASDSVGR